MISDDKLLHSLSRLPCIYLRNTKQLTIQFALYMFENHNENHNDLMLPCKYSKSNFMPLHVKIITTLPAN